jgi:hypothetical protein
MKLLIFQVYTENLKDMASLTAPVCEKYAKRYGFDYELVQVFPTPEKPASWHKLPIVKNRFSKYDWVLCVDLDAFFYNHKTSVLGFIPRNKEIVVSKDGNGYNCGVMAWKATARNADILDKMWSLDQFNHHGWWEQAAFHELANQNYAGMQETIHEVPHHLFNAWEGDLVPETLIFHAVHQGTKMEVLHKILATTDHAT